MSTIITILLSTGCTKTTEDSALEDTACEDMGTWYLDGDEDGFGAEAVEACIQPEGSVDDNSDCDDNDSDTFPGANEICNGEDDNCDGEVDEATAVDAETWYPDLDGDGYGDSSAGEPACEAPSGFIADGTDCDDSLAEVNPGAAEICNGLDDDCNHETPEAGMAHFVDDATGTMTDMSTALAGSEGSPALADLHEDGDLTLCEGDWYVGLDIQASVGIVGLGDPAAIVLNGGGTDTPLMSITGDALEVGVRGLSMSNGMAEMGSAVLCSSSAQDSLLNMRDVAVYGFGDGTTYTYGALALEGCSTDFERVELFDNQGYVYAALLGYYGEHTWTDVEVYDNYASGDVGGVFLVYSDVVFDEVNFSNNGTDGWVGALGHAFGTLDWTGTASTDSGLLGNTDAGYGAVYLYGSEASFDTVDFGTEAGGDDNAPYDVYVSDIDAPYLAGDDASFSCDSEGCGEALTYTVSDPPTGAESHGTGSVYANIYLADAGGVTLTGFGVYGYGGADCYVDWYVATNSSLTDTGWTTVWSSTYGSFDQASASSAGWNESPAFGVLIEEGLYYAVGYGLRDCSSSFYASFDWATSNDGGIGDAAGYAYSHSYSQGTYQFTSYSASYTAPWTHRLYVTEL